MKSGKITRDLSVYKNSEHGGLYLSEVNAALAYFIRLSESSENIGVLQEQIGISNPDLPSSVETLLQTGKDKVVFSCGVPPAHQIAVIVDQIKKEVTVIDSEKKHYERDMEDLFKNNNFFSRYIFQYKKPIRDQTKKEDWSCGIHVVWNVLDTLGMLDDRKNLDYDQWLIKMLDAVEEQHNFLKPSENERRTQLGELIQIAHDAYQGQEESHLKKFLSGSFKAYPLSLGKLQEEPIYRNFNETEKNFLAFIYAMLELDFNKMEAESIVPYFIKLLQSDIARENFIQRKIQKNIEISSEIKSMFEFEINDALKEKPLLEKKKWLKELMLGNWEKHGWDLLINSKIFDQETLEQIESRIQSESGTNKKIESIHSWMGYLFYKQLIDYSASFIQSENTKLAQEQAETLQRDLAIKKQKEAVANHISQIRSFLKDDKKNHETILDLIVGLGKKAIFFASPEGWAEIIKNVDIDETLFHRIMQDYQNGHYDNFYISIAKTLVDHQSDEEAGNLLTSLYVKQYIFHTKGACGLLEAVFVLPEHFQSEFIESNIHELKSSPLPLIFSIKKTDKAKDITERYYHNMKSYHDYNKFVILNHCPKDLVFSLYEKFEENINDLIKNQRRLYEFLLMVPENKQYSICCNYIDSNPNIVTKEFAQIVQIVKRVSSEENKKQLVKQYENRFITNAYTLAEILNVLGSNSELFQKYLDKYKNFINDGKSLFIICATLPTHLRYDFLIKHESLIQSSQDLISNIPLMPKDKCFEFINKYESLLQNGHVISSLVKHLPEKNRVDFIKKYESKIDHINDLARLVSFFSVAEKFQFITRHIELIKTADDLAQILPSLEKEEQVNLIDRLKIEIVSVESLKNLVNAVHPDNRPNLVNQYFNQYSNIINDALEKGKFDEFLHALSICPLEERNKILKSAKIELESSLQLSQIVGCLKREEGFEYIKEFLKTKNYQNIPDNKFLDNDIMKGCWQIFSPDSFRQMISLLSEARKNKQEANLKREGKQSPRLFEQNKNKPPHSEGSKDPQSNP